MANTKNLIFVDSPEVQPEGTLPYLGRQIVSGLEKIPESALAVNEILRGVGEKIPITKPLFKGVKTAQEAIGIPKAEEFRTQSEKALGYKPGSFTPQGLGENIAQEAIPNLVLTGLTGGIGTAARSIKPIIGGAIGGNIAENVADWLGFDQPMKTVAHFAGGLLGQQFGTRNKVVSSYKKDYENALKSIPNPEKTSQKISNFPKIAEKLETKITKRLGFEKAEPIIEKFKNLQQGDQVNIADAWNFKKDLNEEWFKYNPKIRSEIFKPMRDALKEEVLLPYGKTNRQFLDPFLRAEKDFAAAQGGLIKFDKLKESAYKLAGKQLKLDSDKFGPWADLGLKVLYYATPIGGFYQPIIAAGVPTGYTIQQVNKFSKLMSQSPTAQKILKETQKNLVAGNVSNASNLIKRFSAEIEKQDKKQKKNLVFV